MKRYVITLDYFDYADNDTQAIENALNKAIEEDLKNDNKCSVLTIHRADFGSVKPELIYSKTKK